MWKLMKLGEVIEKTETINPEIKFPNESFEYIDVSSVNNKRLIIEETQTLLGKDAPSRARRKVQANDIIFATVRPILKRVAVVPKELDGQICSTGYIVLRGKKDVLLPRYLFYWMTSQFVMRCVESMQTGASYPAVTDKQVKDIDIRIPSIVEQQRIVTMLDAVFAEIDETIKIEREKVKQAESLLENLIREKSLSAMKQYGSKQLAELCELQNGFAFKSTKFRDDGIPVLRISNIQEGSITTDKLVYASQDDYSENLDKYIVKKEVLLIAMSGATTGKVGINKSEKYFYLNQRVGMLTPKETLDRDFLYFFLTTKVEELLSISAGAAQPNLSTKQIKEIRLPNASLAQQRNFSSDLIKLNTEIDSLLSICKIKLRNLASLKSAILTQELNPSEAA